MNLYQAAVKRYKGHGHITLKFVDQVWVMISCSQLSGQMSFREVKCVWREDNDIKQMREENCWGVSHDGMVMKIHQQMPQEEMASKVAEALRLLKVANFRKPFVSIKNRLPLVTDGTTGWEAWLPHKDHAMVDLWEAPGRRCYRSLWDPLLLSWHGILLTPLEAVFKNIDEYVAQFADPFATRNLGRKEIHEIKTITPGTRLQARKRTVVKKEASDER